PVVAAVLAVGEHVDSNLALHLERGQDGAVFDLCQLVLRDALTAKILTRLKQLRRAQQAANVVGAVVGSHATTLPPVGTRCGNSRRMLRAALAILCSFSNAARRGRYFMPQSGATTSCSGAMCSSAARIRLSTTC